MGGFYWLADIQGHNLVKSSPCKLCNSTKHTAWQCPTRPRKQLDASKGFTKKRKPISKIGPVTKKWMATRERWLEANKAPYYFCYICGKTLTRSQLTLDHVKSRSRHPELRFVLKNLQPCCWTCNSEKGSKDGPDK